MMGVGGLAGYAKARRTNASLAPAFVSPCALVSNVETMGVGRHVGSVFILIRHVKMESVLRHV